MIILTIAVPTYNRPEKLKKLHDSFLGKVSSTHQGTIEVIICDNSDTCEQRKNEMLFNNTGVVYKKNKVNLGFSGNILKCLSEAKGEYVWIISDDDSVDFEEFSKFIYWVKKASLEDIKAIVLPFLGKDKQLSNTKETWGNSKSLAEFIESKATIPFILFSSVIVKRPNHLEMEKVKGVAYQFQNNDFIQVPLFMTIIGEDGKITYYTDALQEYQATFQIRFSLYKMINSLEDVVMFIGDYFKLSNGIKRKIFIQCHYKRWMQWMMLHKAGIYEIKDADRVIWSLLWKWRREHFYSFRNLAIAVFCMLPKPLAKVVYKLK